jgi:hypothetical protein
MVELIILERESRALGPPESSENAHDQGVEHICPSTKPLPEITQVQDALTRILNLRTIHFEGGDLRPPLELLS